ncbi:hypothetical protein B0H13DRAFT_1867886 [Mycena leptocephala]|nr:hypothetical protein B0H13DRAFT_1867886 [Mycena leptocephala]
MYPVSTNHHIHYCLWGGTRNQPQYWLDLMNKCTVNLARPAVRESRQNAGSHFARRLRITGVECGESKFHTHITDISRSRKGGMLGQHEIELRGTRTHITCPEKKRDATKIWRERSACLFVDMSSGDEEPVMSKHRGRPPKRVCTNQGTK